MSTISPLPSTKPNAYNHRTTWHKCCFLPSNRRHHRNREFPGFLVQHNSTWLETNLFLEITKCHHPHESKFRRRGETITTHNGTISLVQDPLTMPFPARSVLNSRWCSRFYQNTFNSSNPGLNKTILTHPPPPPSRTCHTQRPVRDRTALPASDAHESSILAEVLGLASIFLPRNRLALLEPYSINWRSPATHFPLCHGFLRPSTPLASRRGAAALPDDPRLPSCSTRRLVCITAPGFHHCRPEDAREEGKEYDSSPNPTADL
jgi:hypothetical protein